MHRQTGPRPRVFVQVMQILHIGLTVQNWLKGNRERLCSACMIQNTSHGVHLHARCRTKISRGLSGAPNTAAVSAWTDWCTGKCAAIQHSLNNLRNGILAKLAQAATTPRSKQVGPRSFHNRQLVMTQQYTRDRQPRTQFESSRRTHMTRRYYHMSDYETGTFFDIYLRPNACCTCVLGLVPWWWERELSWKMISVLLQACFDHKITAWSISINAICKDIGKWVNCRKIDDWYNQFWCGHYLSWVCKSKEKMLCQKKTYPPANSHCKNRFRR